MVYAIALYNDSSYRSQRLCPTGAHPALPGPGSCIKLSFSVPTSTQSSITAEVTMMVSRDQHKDVIFGRDWQANYSAVKLGAEYLLFRLYSIMR